MRLIDDVACVLWGAFGATIILTTQEWWRRRRRPDVFGLRTNGERRRAIYAHYWDAMIDPDSVDSVVTLRAIAMNDYDPKLGRSHVNPAITRRYALMALGQLALQGWEFPEIGPPHTGRRELPCMIDDLFRGDAS